MSVVYNCVEVRFVFFIKDIVGIFVFWVYFFGFKDIFINGFWFFLDFRIIVKGRRIGKSWKSVIDYFSLKVGFEEDSFFIFVVLGDVYEFILINIVFIFEMKFGIVML